MARKTTLFFPLEGTLRNDIKALLALSDGQGQSVVGKEREWIDQAARVVRGMQKSLTVDGVLQLGDL